MPRPFDEQKRTKVKYGFRKAALAAGETHYFTGLTCCNGHVAQRQTTNGACIECTKEKANANRDSRRETARKSAEKNRAKNKQSRLESFAAYRKRHSGRVNARNTLRATAKLRRTPCWLTVDDLWIIEQAYELAALRTKRFGFAWHVDHVIPLQGTRVSGLHVPTNLRVIPGVDNLRKNNQYEVIF